MSSVNMVKVRLETKGVGVLHLCRRDRGPLLQSPYPDSSCGTSVDRFKPKSEKRTPKLTHGNPFIEVERHRVKVIGILPLLLLSCMESLHSTLNLSSITVLTSFARTFAPDRGVRTGEGPGEVLTTGRRQGQRHDLRDCRFTPLNREGTVYHRKAFTKNRTTVLPTGHAPRAGRSHPSNDPSRGSAGSLRAGRRSRSYHGRRRCPLGYDRDVGTRSTRLGGRRHEMGV